MKKRPRFLLYVLVICLCISCVAGCTPTPADDRSPSSPSNTAEMLREDIPFTPGTLQTERLTRTTWNTDRCEKTSGNLVAEAEDGLYYDAYTVLMYAPRKDLQNWHIVCTDPACLHRDEKYGCPANVGSTISVQNGRIFYPGLADAYLKQWDVKQYPGCFLVSCAFDGNDKRMEHSFESASALILDTACSESMYIASNCAIYFLAALNERGTYTNQFYYLDQAGEHLLYSKEMDDELSYSTPWRMTADTFGDFLFSCQMLDSTGQIPYRVNENYELEAVEIIGLPWEGSYLSGNTFRIFRANDGYYDVNLTTREETKLADAQLENSHAYVMLPNCIIESTLMGTTSLTNRTQVQIHAMRFFDGQEWHEVTLPERWMNASDTEYFQVTAVTSDRILLFRQDSANLTADKEMYQIMLDSEAYTLEYAGTLEYAKTLSN